jgi:hypothetical protein
MYSVRLQIKSGAVQWLHGCGFEAALDYLIELQPDRFIISWLIGIQFTTFINTAWHRLIDFRSSLFIQPGGHIHNQCVYKLLIPEWKVAYMALYT